MNEQNFDSQQEQVHQDNNGLIKDSNFELGSHSSHQLLDLQQLPWNMGVWLQEPIVDQGVSQLHNLVPEKSPSSIMSRFESPASLFYATERCMGFPSQYESQVDGSPNLPQFPSGQSFVENYSMGSVEEIRNTLQSVVKSQTSSSQFYKSFEKSSQIRNNNLKGYKHLANQQMNQDSFTTSVRRPFSLAFTDNQEQVSFLSQQEKQSSRASLGIISPTSGNSSPTSQSLSSKTRIRWNQDLHEKFVECVNCLGGADRATPKAILKMMGLEGLTIFHVKSHLQKCRIAKYMPGSTEGKSEKRANVNIEPQLDLKTGLQITEALQLQLDVQRQLHEQLEIQRKLQLRIEKQGEQLKKMFDMQQKRNDNMLKTPNIDSTSNEVGPSNNGIQVSSPEGSENFEFPSKIS